MKGRSDGCKINFSLVVTFIMNLSVRGHSHWPVPFAGLWVDTGSAEHTGH